MLKVQPGIILIDKPAGPTSFRIVQLMKRIVQIKKIGHAGTLDPFASGLLVVCVGRAATRNISELMDGEKEYLATLKLGVETDSQDLTGVVIRQQTISGLTGGKIDNCLQTFIGQYLQTPPQFSALKHKGKPLYHYARKGIVIEKEPRLVFIRELERIDWQNDLLRIRVVCGKGTYIRTLAADIGAQLGVGAHLTELRRMRSGKFSVEEALSGEKLMQERTEALPLVLQNLRPIEDMIKEHCNSE